MKLILVALAFSGAVAHAQTQAAPFPHSKYICEIVSVEDEQDCGYDCGTNSSDNSANCKLTYTVQRKDMTTGNETDGGSFVGTTCTKSSQHEHTVAIAAAARLKAAGFCATVVDDNE